MSPTPGMVTEQGIGRVLVPDSGPKDARIVAIGECPADHEVQNGYPFAGPSGWRLGEWMRAAGIERAECYVTNVFPYQAPRNKVEWVPPQMIETWVPRLHERLAQLTDPIVIVPMGNLALWALLGKAYPPWKATVEERKGTPGISKLRGSLYEYTDLHQRHVKVIPTLHPARTFREPSLEGRCRRDWERIANDSQFRELRLPARHHHINPDVQTVQSWAQDAHAKAQILSIDIERPAALLKTLTKKGTFKVKKDYGAAAINCVGFSWDHRESLTIPTTQEYWGNPETVRWVWAVIKGLCEAPMEKVLTNGGYDGYHLWWEQQIQLVNYQWDCLGMHHALDPADEHALHYMASCDTREPYWKDEAKAAEEVSRYLWNMDQFYRYNGKDVCVQRELCDVYRERLRAWGMLEFYLRTYPPRYRALLRLMLTGVRVDEEARKHGLGDLTVRVIDAQDRLTDLTGVKLYARKKLSPKKLQEYMYGTLGLPEQTRKRGKYGERTVTSDEVAVRRLMLQYPERFEDAGKLILQIQRDTTLMNFYKKERVDPDGRMRGFYGINTEEGRLNSTKNPRGSGSNLQNQDREVRGMFLADPGCLGVEVDGSQVEARLCFLAIYALTGDKDMLWKAMARPAEYDQHTENAAAIFKVPVEELRAALRGEDKDRRKWAKDIRFLGKKTVHAKQRDMQGKTMAEQLLKEGHVLTEQECDRLLERYMELTPGLQSYFIWVKQTIHAQRYMVNHWGRVLRFTYDRLGEETYRRGYSFLLQSDCADHINNMGFVPFDQEIEAGRWPGAAINVNGHDSLFCSFPPAIAYEATKRVVELLEAPRRYYGVDFVLPCEIKVGRTWEGEAAEFKAMPGREEFEAVVQRCGVA